MEIKPLPQDFLGGPGVKNLPADAKDTGLIPGLGRSCVLWGSAEPTCSRACAPEPEKPPQEKLQHQNWRVIPAHRNYRKAYT